MLSLLLSIWRLILYDIMPGNSSNYHWECVLVFMLALHMFSASFSLYKTCMMWFSTFSMDLFFLIQDKILQMWFIQFFRVSLVTAVVSKKLFEPWGIHFRSTYIFWCSVYVGVDWEEEVFLVFWNFLERYYIYINIYMFLFYTKVKSIFLLKTLDIIS